MLRPMLRCCTRQLRAALLGCTPRSIRRISSSRNTASQSLHALLLLLKPLLLRPHQLPERRIIPQRLEREVTVQLVGLRIPLGDRVPEQAHGDVPLAEQRLDARPPHRVPAEEIPPLQACERLVGAERRLALSLARRD